MRHLVLLSAAFLVLASCATSSPRPQRSEFEDIPVPRGLTLDLDRTTIIESPTVKAARLFYKGRVEVQSLGVAFRSTLESNGWKNLSSNTSSNKGITQVYEKPGASLQVNIWEDWSTTCMFSTCVELSAARFVSPAAGAAGGIPTTPMPPAGEAVPPVPGTPKGAGPTSMTAPPESAPTQMPVEPLPAHAGQPGKAHR
jgi:hypothetical protein